MEMPRPGPDHERLHRLAGTWRGTEKMYPSTWDPKGGEAQGESQTRVALGGFALVTDYRQSRGGQCTFEGHGVYTIDAKSGEVVMHWFDCLNQGSEEFRGRFDGDRLTLTSRNPMGFARMSYDLSKPDVVTSRMAMSQDGQTWSDLFDGSYTRAG